MTIVYATYSDFTAVYSIKGVSQSEISSTFLPQGALRLHEALGSYFTTPFSSNNFTARDLNIKYAYLELQTRNRAVQETAAKIEKNVESRKNALIKKSSPMVLDDGTSLFSNTERENAFSTTQNYNPTFNMLDPKMQHVDCDLEQDTFDLTNR